MASSKHGFGHSFWIRREQQGLPSIPQINPLTVAKSSSRRHRKYITNAHPGLMVDANNSHQFHSMSIPAQPTTTLPPVYLSQPVYLQPAQEWAPRSLLQRSASTIAVPGMTGEGIYKLSRVKSNPISRSSIRRLPSSMAGEAEPVYLTRPRIARQPSRLSSSHVYFNRKPPASQPQPRPHLDVSKMKKHFMTGLTEATWIWDEHRKRGKEESDSVSDLIEKIRIWLKHAKVCHLDLKKADIAMERRMRGQPVGTLPLRRLAKPAVGSRFPSGASFIPGRSATRSTPQPTSAHPSSTETFTRSAPSPVFSSRSTVDSSHSDLASFRNNPFSSPRHRPSLTAAIQSSPDTTISLVGG